MLERSDEMAGPLFIRRILTKKAIIIIFVNASSSSSYVMCGLLECNIKYGRVGLKWLHFA